MSEKIFARLKQWFSRFFEVAVLFGVLSVLINIFGKESEIVALFKGKILYTPYNVTGMIMLPLSVCGIWIGKENGKKLFSIISGFLTFTSALSWVTNIISWIPPEAPLDPEITKKVRKAHVIAIIVLIVTIAIVIWWIISSIRNRAAQKEIQNRPIETAPPIHLDSPRFDRAQVKTIEKNKSEPSVSPKKSMVPPSQKKEERKEQSGNKPLSKKDAAHLIARKICPECGGELISRQNHTTEKWFMGCQNYFTSTQCKFTLDYKVFKDIERDFS